MRKTLMLALLAVTAVLAATLPVASPAFAAPGAGKPGKPPPPPPPPPPSASAFIKAFADTRATSNAAFGNDVSPTTDGGYIAAGSVGVPGTAWVAKLSATGTVTWQEQLAGQSEFKSVQQTADGGYIVAGDTQSEANCVADGFTSTDCAWVVKLSPTGAVQWQQVFPGAHDALATQVKQTTDGGYIVTGNTNALSSSAPFAWIAKLTSTGALVWQRQFGAAPFASASSVAQTPDGGYVISGSSGAINSSSVLVAKFSATGDIQWQKTYGTGNEDLGESVQPTSDGGYIVGGEIVIQNSDASRPGEALLLKLTPNGDIQFQDVFNAGVTSDLSSEATSVRQTPDGGYILAGRESFESGLAGFEASWLAKTTAAGALSWQHVFAVSPHFSLFNSVQLTSDGGYIAAGTTGIFDNSDNVWLVKTDASGNVAGGQCTAQANGATTEQPGPLTAVTSSFPSVMPSNNPPAATADTPATTRLITQTVC